MCVSANMIPQNEHSGVLGRIYCSKNVNQVRFYVPGSRAINFSIRQKTISRELFFRWIVFSELFLLPFPFPIPLSKTFHIKTMLPRNCKDIMINGRESFQHTFHKQNFRKLLRFEIFESVF